MANPKHRRKNGVLGSTFLSVLLIQIIFTRSTFGAEVYSLSPRYGSLCGETRILISGNGFSQNNMEEGNQVQLVSMATSYDCVVNKDGTMETMIMCYTVSGMVEGLYQVKVTVDGIPIPEENMCQPEGPSSSLCQFEVRSQNTPLIKSVEPVSFPPGPESILTLQSLMFTSLHGTHVTSGSNGLVADPSIHRVYAGPLTCDLYKNIDELYGLELDSQNSYNGHIKCRYQGNYIGNSNASFIVGDGPYGRSCRNLDTLLVSITKEIYQFQTYAEITGISPAMGSTAGGTTLIITGNYFTASKEDTRVYIGDVQCMITSMTSSEIQCITAPKPGNLPPYFCGNRGLLLEVWTSGSKLYSELGDIASLTTSDAGYSDHQIGQSFFSHSASNYVSRTRGFFIAPYTGEYSFRIKSADASSLRLSTDSNPANKVEIAKCEGSCPGYWSSPNQMSARMLLNEHQRYYMEILHSYGTSGIPLVQVGASYYNVPFTNKTTGLVDMEHQLVKVTSTVVREVQQIKVETTPPVGEKVHEVQVIEIHELSEGFSDAMFRLGLYGVYTEPLSSTSTPEDLASAIENLPWYFNGEDTITVLREESTTPEVKVTLEVEFLTSRGDIPLLEYILANGSLGEMLEIQVTEKVKGHPEHNVFVLEMEGIVSSVFLPNESSAEVIKKVDEMFTTRCPKFLGKTGTFHSDFETGSGSSGGELVDDREALCGRGIVKNPTYLYNNADGFYLGSTLNTICFGYHGAIQDSVTVKYSYMDETMTLVENRYKTFSITIGDESEEWKYTCFDLQNALTSFISNGQLFKIQYIKINRGGDVFIDEVYIGNGPSTKDPESVNLMRLKPVMPNGHRIHYIQGAMTSVDSIHNITITFFPVECGHDFPLFNVVSGQTNGINVNVERLRAASPPVSGTFTLTFGGQESLVISPNVTAKEFKEILLTSVTSMGEIYTYKHGDCSNFVLSVAFLSNPGDLETIQFTSQLSGNDVAMSVETVIDGNLNLDPIQGDMLCTYSGLPQVTAFVSDIPSQCSVTSPGTGCSFTWDTASTPVINSCSQDSSTITISGSGFSANTVSTVVTVQGQNCPVDSSSENTITCSLPSQIPAGTFPVQVTITGKGEAVMAAGASCDITSDSNTITSVNPTFCGLGGGCLMTISGEGFSAESVITVENKTCETKAVNYSQIQFVAPSMDTVGSAQVKVSVAAQSAVSSIDYNNPPLVDENSIEITEEILDGKPVHKLVFTGSNLADTSNVRLLIQEKEVTSVLLTPGYSLTATFDLLPPGTYLVYLLTDLGHALDSTGNIPSITVSDRQITNVFPPTGSLRGGTKLTISGQGFSTLSSANKVKVGDNDCVVESSSSTELKCQIADTGRTHIVTNDGVHPSFKISGYAWEPKHLQIKTGDTVQWKWEFAPFISGMKVRVVQVKGLLSQEEEEEGFNSGLATSKGVYQFQFLVPGTYYYWSDFVDFYKTTYFFGVIEVLDPVSYAAEVQVMLSDIVFTHVKPGTSDPPSVGSCPGTTGDQGSCSIPIPSASDTNKWTFGFWDCATPLVNKISLRKGTTFDIIEVEGVGLSVNTCELEVKFGDIVCIVQGISDLGFQCTIDSGNNPTVGQLQEISILVKNRGYALINIEKRMDRSFALIPAISNISPELGSSAGGSLIAISGTGFPDDKVKVTVSIGGYNCPVESSSFTQITCLSVAQTTGSKTVEVSVLTPSGSYVMAICKHLSGMCTFSFSSAVTPVLISVAPDAITGTGESTLTLTGTNLKSSAEGATVHIGGQECTVQSQSADSLTCSITNLPLGENMVTAVVTGYGNAVSSLVVTSPAVISSLTPATGSIYGGTTLTFNGNGFTLDASVDIGGVKCEVKTATLSSLICETGAHAAGISPVDILIGSVTYPQQDYEYQQNISPEITAVSPISGSHGETVTITGQNLTPVTKVTIGEQECSLISETAIQIQCTTAPHAVGPQSVVVQTIHGKSNSNIKYEYVLELSMSDPISGSIYGGHNLDVVGAGFDENVEVRICGEVCQIDFNSLIASQLTCLVPPSSDETAKTCDIVVTSNGQTRSFVGGYIYELASTPTVTNLHPTVGGTGGGTLLTISGTGFGSDEGFVKISGSTCAVIAWSDDTISCTTDSHEETSSYPVSVYVPNTGFANPGSLEFSYIDLWSSPWTWGGGLIPQEGDLVVIKEGHTVLLDINTPILNTVLIDGGTLVFDQKDLELQAQKILITKGGKLQVGTESEPFSSRAVITMHGHVRSKELPVYGTKMIGARNGSLELHGKTVVTSWTRLENTAAVGATEIVLTHPVDWASGDTIVIATTNHRHRQQETEQHTIASVSADGRRVTLTQPLMYEHLGVVGTYGGQDVEFRAEVGLLSRTITFRGTIDDQWNDVIEKCPQGFDTGEFAVRPCFQGLFEEEIGVDQFGAHIILHAPQPNSGSVHAHIEYVEFHYVGQAFRLGRYPIHFHLNGDMTGSYVRGCSFHRSFNRAVNIHGTHNVVVEQNVAFNIMGGAMFLEDGIEHGNTFQYNLMLFVVASSSLQNDDNAPAAFWITNPDNIVQHNAVAGGTHFGFWYRMHEHPSGPSFTTTVCPQKIPVGKFFNNTVHSNGWFGLWVFQRFTPRVGGTCNSPTPEASVFSDLTVWNCEKGAEIVDGGSVHLKNFVLVNNKLAGYEGKLVVEGSQTIENALIVGYATELTRTEQGCTRDGIKLPYGYGFHVKNVKFVNFDENGCAAFGATRITGTCTVNCGGYTYTTEGLTFINAQNRGHFFWAWEALIKDVDGSLTSDGPLTEAAGKTVLPTTGTLPPTCVLIQEFSVGDVGAVVCPSELKYHRFTFNKVPSSLEGKNAIFINDYGTSVQPFRSKAVTHKNGWLIVFLDGMEYTMSFQDSPGFTNFTYTGRIDNFETSDEYVLIKQNIQQEPSRFFIDWSNHIPKPDTAIETGLSSHGHWEYSQAGMELKYLVRGHDPSTVGATTNTNINVRFEVYKCFYEDCKPPPDPNTVPPEEERPNDAVLWSDKETWSDAEEGWGGYLGEGLYDLPQDGDSVKIPKGKWVVGDTTLPRMEQLVLYGVLELDDDNGNRDFELRCKYIIIRGGRLIIGWPNKPFLANALVILEGDRQTEYFEQNSGPTIGSKVLAAFGGVDMHGIQRNDSWTHLAQTALAGDSQITLESAMDWVVGDEIIIAPTGYKPEEVERFTITAISTDSLTITLDGLLNFKHIAHTHTANGQTLTMAAEVGRLTRNIRFEGASYANMQKEAFGARIMVSRIVENGQLYIGYARISNVEFRYTGQEGWVERGDARSSVSFTDAGTVNFIKPSYVKQCSFHKGFSPAITVHGTSNLPIEWNVMADTVWFALETTSSSTQISRNFVTNVRWDGCFNGRSETLNVRYNGAFNLNRATNLVLEYNAVGGAQRVGYSILGEECGATSVWKDNVAHSTLLGVANIQNLTPVPEGMDCIQINNFQVWKNLDYGIYYNNLVNTIVKGVKAADNGVSVFQFVVGPSAVSHLYENKFAKVMDSLIVGTSDVFDCSTDIPNANDCNIKLSMQSRAHSRTKRLGITMPTFSSGGNNAPEKPFAGIMAYQAIGGQAFISGVTFSKFSNLCSGGRDMVIAPNFQNDDGNHRLETSMITFIDVDEESKVFYPRSDLGKINPSDCVDMACDAKVKSLLVDTDGSFLGQAGTVIPQSEYQWNGDPAYMLGDYRVPKEMQVTVDGERIPMETLAPHKGIIRDNTCDYITPWQAYKCPSFKHYTLTIESMDKDSETRRISPVAILGNGYLDLINGPQDHGWCSGYTCRKRLSTFQSIVALSQDYLIHYTGTSPQHTRFMMLDAGENDCIQVSVWYSQPWRLDVYHDDTYILPANARQVGGANTIVYDAPPVGEPDKYKPSAATCADVSGSNFYNRDANVLTFLIKGPKPVRIVTVNSVIVSLQFPPMTLEEFFGENIIMNIAAFLDIDPKFVRVTDITRETTTDKRKRRAISENIVGASIEISNPPGTPTDSDSLNEDNLDKISTDLINGIQLTNFSSTINMAPETSYSISQKMPETDSPEWQQITSNNSDGYVVVQVASHMIFHTDLEPLHEGAPFKIQPKIQVVDNKGEIITMLGADENTWKITATIRENTGNPNAALLGNTTVQFINGMAVFSDLAISHYGTDYILDFTVTEPAVGEPFMIASKMFSLKQRPIAAAVQSKAPVIVEGSQASITLELRDAVTGQVIDEIGWRGHSWKVTASIGMAELYQENIMVSQTTTFDENSGQATFDNLRFDASGVFVVHFNITTTPADYSIEHLEIMVVRSMSQESITTDISKEIGVKFEADYDSIIGESYNQYFAAMVLNWVAQTYIDIIPAPKLVYKGSIMVTFNIGGNEENVTSTISSLCIAIQNGTEFTFTGHSLTLSGYMTVEGNKYYGVSCGIISSEDGTDSAMPIIIAVSTIGGLLIIAVISMLACMIYKTKISPRTKTHDLEHVLKNEKSFTSVRSYKQNPPKSTALTGEKRTPVDYW